MNFTPIVDLNSFEWYRYPQRILNFCVSETSPEVLRLLSTDSLVNFGHFGTYLMGAAHCGKKLWLKSPKMAYQNFCPIRNGPFHENSISKFLLNFCPILDFQKFSQKWPLSEWLFSEKSRNHLQLEFVKIWWYPSYCVCELPSKWKFRLENEIFEISRNSAYL